MSSFKKLNKADVTTVNYHANKRWSLSYTGIPNDSYAYYYIGKNEPFTIGGSTINGQYKSLIYSEINHLFYQVYTSSLNTGSIMFNINTYESASSQRPTASYFNYNTNPLLIKQFPSSSGNQIGVLSINQDIFGSKILPNSFNISSSAYSFYIKDDGNGNLYNSSTFVGNIFYAHGIAVITNPSYYSYFTGSSAIKYSFQNEHIIYENEVRCIIRESEFNLSYNPTLVTGNYYSGSLRGFATGSDFQPYVTTIGLYNDTNDLLMVAKLAKPIMLSPDTDTTFIVRYDT
jgi:hypothetical protein